MTSKIVTSSELRTNIKQVLNEVEYGSERYIIEKFGQPSAAIISIEDYQFFQAINAILEAVESKNEDLPDNKTGEPSVDESSASDEGKRMTRQEMVASLMRLLEDSDKIPEAAEQYMKNDMIMKLLVTLQYLEAQVSKLEAKLGIANESQVAQIDSVPDDSPYGQHWGQFVGAFAGEAWERPSQGALEERESW